MQQASRLRLFSPAIVMVVMMFLGYSVSFMDRQIVSVLVEPIKAELRISDGEVGLLTGLSFTLLYCTMSLPIAALADRYSRKRIIVVAMLFWSAMTALFGLANTYPELFLARMGVGIGEAAFAPAAFSMLADYFSPARRSTAMGFGASGSMLGTTLGLALGGYVTQHADWRVAMMAAAVPGFVVAAAFGLFVREPTRGMSSGSVPPMQEMPSFSALTRNSAYLLIVSSATVAMFVLFACVQWFPAYLVRSFHMTESAVGTLLGPILGALGAASLLGSGYVTDVLSRRDVRWGVWTPAVGAFAGVPLLALALYAKDLVMTLTLFGLAYFAVMFMNAPITSMIQSLVPPALRARATAVFMVMTTLVGFGIGPAIAGFLSDAYQPALGQESLRYALLTLIPVLVISPLLLALAGSRLARNLPVQGGGLSPVRLESPA